MKKIKFIALIILVYCLFISCKSKQITKTINSIDTIKVEKIIKIQTPQLNSIKIESVCDSVGALKQFKYTFTSDKVKVSLIYENDCLVLDVTGSIKKVRLASENSGIRVLDEHNQSVDKQKFLDTDYQTDEIKIDEKQQNNPNN